MEAWNASGKNKISVKNLEKNFFDGAWNISVWNVQTIQSNFWCRFTSTSESNTLLISRANPISSSARSRRRRWNQVITILPEVAYKLFDKCRLEWRKKYSRIDWRNNRREKRNRNSRRQVPLHSRNLAASKIKLEIAFVGSRKITPQSVTLLRDAQRNGLIDSPRVCLPITKQNYFETDTVPTSMKVTNHAFDHLIAPPAIATPIPESRRSIEL